MSHNTLTYPTQQSVVARKRISTNLLVGVAVITTGLLAGVYYGWAVSVMPGMRQSSDPTAVEALWQMNRAIQNPMFFLSFAGAPIVSLWLLLRARRSVSGEALRWIAAGFALNALGLLITAAFNIPLNNALDKAFTPAHPGNLAATRHHFENPWIAWNIVRTLVTTAALCCLARVAFLRARTVQQ
jgi:uncharacterized membrane protein